MSKSDRDGRGFRHHKKCPSLNCDRCVNGRSKLPFRQKQRREAKRAIRSEQTEST